MGEASKWIEAEQQIKPKKSFFKRIFKITYKHYGFDYSQIIIKKAPEGAFLLNEILSLFSNFR